MATDDQATTTRPLEGIRALLFDVFGTTVDWRSTVVSALIRYAHKRQDSPGFAELPGPLQDRLRAQTDGDWAELAREWRKSYGEFTSHFVPAVTEWKDIDTHHIESLVQLLENRGLSDVFTDGEVKSLSLVWHRLDPWQDTCRGLELLGSTFVTSTLSNGNRSLLKDLKEHGNLPFQRIISTADFKAYKPHPSTYLGAVNALGVRPEQCAMIAAHLSDLIAAKSCGLKAVYVERPGEESWGDDTEAYREAKDWVDIWIQDGEEGFVGLAKRLRVCE